MFRSSYQIYFAHWISHVHLMIVPALLPFLPQFFGVGFLELGAGMSVLMLVTLILQIPMGFMVDRYGAKRMLGIGMLTSAAALFSLAIFPSFTWFLVVMGVLGVVNTIYHPADYALLAQNVDPQRLGRAFSFHTFAGYFGTAVTPVMMFAAVTVFGVPGAFVLVGALALAAVYVLEPVHRVLNGHRYSLFTRPEKVLSDISQPSDLDRQQRRRSRMRFGLQLLSLTFFFACLYASTAPIEGFGNATLILGYGFDEGTATLLVSLFLLVMALGVLAGGWLADLTEHHGLIAAYSVACTTVLMLVVTLFSLPQWGLFILLVMVGLLLGVIAPSRDMMVKRIAPVGAEGRIFAIVSTGYSIGGALAPLYLAWFLDHGLPHWVFGAAVVTMVLVVIISFLQERTTPSSLKNVPAPAENYE